MMRPRGESPITTVKRHLANLGGVPVRDVPPDWVGRHLPLVDERVKPEVAWWARHQDGRLTPVWVGSVGPDGPEK